MKRTLLMTTLLSAIALSACQKENATSPEVTATPTQSEQATPIEPAPRVDSHVTEAITAIGTATVMRQSDRKDEDGKSIEPFTGARVIFSTTKSGPKNGANIFMWPLRNSPQPMNVKVSNVESHEACNGSNDKMFAMTGAPESTAEILAAKPDAGKSAEFPFEMAYVIPSQPKAKLVQPPDALPPGITIATVKFALDLNDDGHADALYVTSDCDSGGAVTKDTGGTCTASYLMKESKWVLLDSTSPC